MSDPRLRLGVDIGGTFTDLVLSDPASGALWNGKVLTTPADPSEGVLAGIDEVTRLAGVAPQAIAQVIHGTTLVANAIIERKGVRTGFVTTAGFRDLLVMAREWRWDIYDLNITLAAPLVPRSRSVEVTERLGPDGAVLIPFDPGSAEEAVQRLAAMGVEAVAVTFLHAFRNPAHERAMAEVIARHLSDVEVSLSSEVAPALGEYERATTTVANAYVQPVFRRYLARLAEGLRALGVRSELLLMQSDGGTIHQGAAMRYPVRLVQSGPAGGAQATALAGAAIGAHDVLAFDMGGTTAKACLIADGEPSRTSVFEVARIARFRPGSGLPLLVPAIDMIEIGAGGGSIARVNALGVIEVGPDSAGADPGPACYGRGGTQPTVTDADLLLGHLDAGSFLGGTMRLDRAAAEAAIRRAIAEPLGLSVIDAALGIRAIVDESMAQAAAIHAIEKGVRVADYAMVAIGGAGPVHACDVARRLGMRRVICPAGAGVASAFGFLASPVAFAAARSHIIPLAAVSADEAAVLLDALADEALCHLAGTGVDHSAAGLDRLAELRYRGQGHAIEVALPDPRAGDWHGRTQAAFEARYRTLYDRIEPRGEIEIVTWRVVARGPRPQMRMSAAVTSDGEAVKGVRAVFCANARRFRDATVYDRYRLAPGRLIVGPAVVEERESTAVIPEGATASTDAAGHLVIRLAEADGGGMT
ncbi:hydantoinase/oxoprolinase family protein [Elioraea tepidiphila]|uniref:hydantoinase/oxoprolinase family protein n=1 Tax=Elioraea tepidiphila TaxID=457934 RepID=UPI002FDAF13C